MSIAVRWGIGMSWRRAGCGGFRFVIVEVGGMEMGRAGYGDGDAMVVVSIVMTFVTD